MQFAQHFAEEFVQDVLRVLAAEVALDNQREREERDARGAGVDDEQYKARVADELAGDAVEADGGEYHDAEGDERADHVQEGFLHAVGAVLFGPHEYHGEYLQYGARGTDDGHALDAETHFGSAEQDVRGNGRGEDAGVEEGRHPHALAGVEAAHEYGLQAEPEAYGQVPAEDFGNGFGGFALECAALEQDAHRREAQGPYGDDGGNQYAEHAREALPDFAVELREVAFLDEARHVGVARDAYGEPEDRHQRVHHSVGVVEARNAARAEVRAEAPDDEFEPEHGAHAERHREHHLEVAHDIGMLGLDNEFVMHAATPGAENLEREEADEGAHRHAPGESFQAVIRAGVLAERDTRDAAEHDGHVVDEARERGNQELLAGVLHGHQDAAHEDEHLAGQDDAAIVRGALDKFRRGAVYGKQLQEFLHPDECGNHENQERDAEGVQDVAEEFPAALLVACHLVARENRDEDDGEESGTHHMVQDVRNHEGEVERVLFERDARCVGEQHFAEDSENAAQEHGYGDDYGGFVHDPIR